MRAQRLHPESNRVQILPDNDWEREFLRNLMRESGLRRNWVSVSATYYSERCGIDSIDVGILTSPRRGLFTRLWRAIKSPC